MRVIDQGLGFVEGDVKRVVAGSASCEAFRICMPHGRWEVVLLRPSRHCNDSGPYTVIPGRCDSIEPGISRFRVRVCDAPRNDSEERLLRRLGHRPEIGKIPAATGCGIK